ncbi:XrtY-associated glycosyltransferase XYAG1 [Mucilaginibacter sp. KACC 22063]|uniref:XrtY-associated glycosyltransferase XYAG1 n=1 Tax=Mucilaginibacter sp. KACC 22063 TaxID=3025666 RepID=UPI00236676F0|nr:glycosyltransferase [Mucilaginibacter sp. KACC 22063]WDF54456.1 glycosyltransferase [Mucilaginibacter sp. KACC 22063]
MKILHIVPSYKPAYVYGGPIESVARLCEGLAAQGHDVDVFTTTANGKTELDIAPGSTVDVDGVNVTYFKRITKDPTHVSPALWKHLFYHVKEYDVVHIHSWWNILVMVAAKICLLKGAKTIIAPRGMLSGYIFNSGNSKAKKLMHKFFGRSILSKSFFHATSEAEYKECISLIDNWKGFMLPNILSLPELKIADKNNDVFTVIFMSRIHPKKGIEILLKAIANLNFAVKLKIAGSGEDEYITKLKQLAGDFNIADKIEWLGWQNREQKFKELMNADLFALISYNENFANVVIESLHAGTATIVSEHVALSDFVEKNDLGWVTTLDVDNVTAKLTDAYHDQAKRDRIAKDGSYIIAKYFSADKLISDYFNIYTSI